MRIYRSLAEVPPDFGPSALSIGNFDGVHAGHRHLFRRVLATARQRALKPSVLTFDPHPTRVVAPARAPRLMTTPEERCRFMAEEGIEQALILPFDREIARLSPERFVVDILVKTLDAKAVLVGENFHFGYRQAGNAEVLGKLGVAHGFTTEIVPPVVVRGGMVSSSSIRQLLAAGNVVRAARLLGRPHALEGPVVKGFGIGSRQTVPTLNLAPATELLPANGVYITCTRDQEDGRVWPSITNIGKRPTFEGHNITVETFLLEPLTGSTPRQIRVELLRRVREERKFASPEALKEQILRDVARARAYLRRRARWGGRRPGC